MELASFCPLKYVVSSLDHDFRRTVIDRSEWEQHSSDRAAIKGMTDDYLNGDDDHDSDSESERSSNNSSESSTSM